MFTFNNIYLTNKKSNSVTNIKNVMEDYDLTQSCLEALLILEEEYTEINVNHIRSTYLGMKENSIEILQESLGDALQSIIKFFGNLLTKFKEFMNNAIMFITAYLGDFDKFLEKYKEPLSKLQPDFKIKGFTYTIKSDIPKVDKIKNIIDDYNNDLNNIDKLNKADIIKERDENTSSSYLDKVRAYILGETNEISSSDYVEACRKSYRNSSDKEEDIHVNKALLDNTISQYPNLRKLEKDAIKQRDETIILIESMKNFFQRSSSVYYKGKDKTIGANKLNFSNNHISNGDAAEVNYDVKKYEVINTFFNSKFAQSRELGSITVTAMVEKVNAIKEELKLNREIIRKSLSLKNIDKDKNKEAK